MMIAAGEGESAGDEMGNEELSDDNLSLFSHSAAEAKDSEHADRGDAGAPIDDAPFLAEVFCNKVEDNHDVQLMGIAPAAQQLLQWLDDSRSYCDHLEWFSLLCSYLVWKLRSVAANIESRYNRI